MAKILHKEEIKRLIKNIDVVDAMEKGFIAYSNNKTVVPPVGELILEENNGDVHIKYGYIRQDDFYVIKIAAGFYDNPKIGLPSSQGLMLLFSQKTGQTEAILLDEGMLTDIRTAAAGALVAKYFAPSQVNAIGIIGTGTQARLQLQYLQSHTPCKKVYVWGRNLENAAKFKEELSPEYNITIADSPREVAQNCNLIVTTTPSKSALLMAANIQAGTHITAVGSDTADKIELDPTILASADRIIVDSIPQSKSRGEVFQALNSGKIKNEDVLELGMAIQDNSLHRTNDNQITIADLTGVAVQDIMIAKSVYLESLK